MKGKILGAHSEICWAKKKSNPWSGGTVVEWVWKNAIFRGKGHWHWLVWSCACPQCPAKIAIRYDALVDGIGKISKSLKAP